MSEKSPVQATVHTGTFNITVSAESMEELATITSDAQAVVDNLVNIDQLLKAKSAVTGVVGVPTNSAPVSSGYQTTPPPGMAAPGGQTCKHGAMLDLADSNYKYRWYCPAPKGEGADGWKAQCKPIGG